MERVCRKGNPCIHRWQECKLVKTLENSLEVPFFFFILFLNLKHCISFAELPYDPAIPLLSIYLEKNLVCKDTCTPIFTAALYTITKTWKQPRCPSIDERIKKTWYIYTMELILNHQKEGNTVICSNTNGPGDYNTM